MSLTQLMNEWKHQKAIEEGAQRLRREIEDQIKQFLQFDETKEGTTTKKAGNLELKITNRFTKKIDSDQLQEIAAENGTSEHLRHLFRWVPRIDANAWKAADSSITSPFLGAIETKPGRPSFKIQLKED